VVEAIRTLDLAHVPRISETHCTVLGPELVSAGEAPAAPGRRRKAAPGSIMPVSMTVPQRRVNLGALMAKVLR
jgi:hypothetical protein